MEALNSHLCPVCREIMIKAVLYQPCSHQVCDDCFPNLLQSKKCPVCREAFQDNTVIRSDKTEELKKEITNCACGKSMNILEYKTHSEQCEKLKESEEKAKTNLLDKSKMKATVNRSTFKCPLCQQSNLERSALVEHIKTIHPHKKGVCPICVAQPWGDPNYVTTLSSHMEMRHKFDYDTYTDYDREDDLILQQVLHATENEDEALRLALELSKNEDEALKQALALSQLEH